MLITPERKVPQGSDVSQNGALGIRLFIRLFKIRLNSPNHNTMRCLYLFFLSGSQTYILIVLCFFALFKLVPTSLYLLALDFNLCFQIHILPSLFMSCMAKSYLLYCWPQSFHFGKTSFLLSCKTSLPPDEKLLKVLKTFYLNLFLTPKPGLTAL